MDVTTLTLILGFLATQVGVVIAFLKWKEDNRREVNKFLTMTTSELAELKRILATLLDELGYPKLATDVKKTKSASKAASETLEKE